MSAPNGPSVWIGTSWKMHKTLAEAKAFATAVARAETPRDVRIQRFVIPPFTAVRQVKEILAATSIKVGAQNMHWADQGAWTGEISPLMLKDCNLDLVELGHSERREHFGETDETVGLKVEAAVRSGKASLVLHAVEAAEDGVRKIAQARRATVHLGGPAIPAYKLFSQAELGLAFGATNVIHAAVLAGDAGKAVGKRMVALDRYRGGSPDDLAMLAAAAGDEDAAEDVE